MDGFIPKASLGLSGCLDCRHHGFFCRFWKFVLRRCVYFLDEPLFDDFKSSGGLRLSLNPSLEGSILFGTQRQDAYHDLPKQFCE